MDRTPVFLQKLLPYLAKYPWRADAAMLYKGFTEGFQILYTGARVVTDCNNLKSARELPEVVVAKLGKEC